MLFMCVQTRKMADEGRECGLRSSEKCNNFYSP